MLPILEFVLVVYSPKVSASITYNLGFQARLLTPDLEPVPDKTYAVKFSLYNQETGGSAVWAETQSLSIKRGVLATELGKTTSLSGVDFDASALYLGIAVDSDPEMTPRKRVLPTPTALNADKLRGLTPGTGANNVLQLDLSGNINIAGSITAASLNLSGEASGLRLQNVASLPGTGSAGQLIFNTATGLVYVYKSGAWSVVGGNLQQVTDIGATTTATVTVGGLTTTGTITVGGLTTTGTVTAGTVSLSGNGSISSSGSNITINKSLVPTATGFNLGSVSVPFATGYFDNLNVNTTNTSGTTAAYFAINTDAADNESGGIRVYLGPTANSYATLQWDASNSRFNLLSNEGSTTYGALRTSTLTAPTIQTASGSLSLTPAAGGGVIIAPTAGTSGSPTLLTVTGPAHTTLAASTEAIDVNLNLARTVQFATGALTTQRAAVVQAPTYAFVGASIITNAATLAITGAPVAGTNATITNPMALWVQGGVAAFAGNVGVGTTNPSATVHVVGQCVTGDTRLRRRRRRKKRKGEIEEDWEEVPIKDIQVGDEIQTFDEATGRFVWQKVRQLMDMGVKSIYTLTTAAGKTIRTTAEHPYLVKRMTDIEWLRFAFVDETGITLDPGQPKLGVGALVLHHSEFAIGQKLHQVFVAAVTALKQIEERFEFKFKYITAQSLPYYYQLLNILEEDLSAWRFESVFEPRSDKNLWEQYLELVQQLFNGREHPHVVLADYLNKPKQSSRSFADLEQNAGIAKSLQLESQGTIFLQVADILLGAVSFLEHHRKDRYKLGVAQRVAKLLEKQKMAGIDSIYAANDTVPPSVPFVKGARWTKVSELKVGQMIAVAGTNGQLLFEQIVKIERTKAEQVFDIEVEGTHNFVGNDIVAHNTYINSTATTANIKGLEIDQSGAVSGTGYGLHVEKTGASTTNVAGYFSATGATNNYGLIVENGNVGIGDTSPAALLTVGAADAFQVNSSGQVAAGTWNGTAITDTYVADTLTTDISSAIQWAGLTGYPSACSAGSAVSTLADTPTCTSFNTDTAITLQDAYDATSGNTIATTDARNIAITLADTTTDANLTVTTATGGTGYLSIARADGAGAADPAQLVLLDNLDADRAQPIGLKIQSAAGALTTAIDVSDAEIGTALAIGANDITTSLTTISSAELDRLDGKDAALVDTNDAVATAITGVGTVTSGTWNGTAVGATYGGTGQTTVTTGDLLYGSATNTWSKLADVATGSVLISGGVGVAPSWSASPTLTTSLTVPLVQTASGNLALQAASGIVTLNEAGVQNYLRVYDSGGTKYTQVTHDGTNGGVTTSSGDLNLSSATGGSDFIVGDVGAAVNLVFEESSTISGQGANTITVGVSGDTWNLNTAATYNFGTLSTTAGNNIILSPSSNAQLASGKTFGVQGGSNFTIGRSGGTGTATVNLNDANASYNVSTLATASGNMTLQPASGSKVTLTLGGAGDVTATFGATGSFQIDGAATDTTLATGVLDIDVDSDTASASAVDVNLEGVGSTASLTQNAINLAVIPSNTTNARTYRGLNLSATDAGAVANTLVGLNVDVTTANASDTTYAAIFSGGNVGIGTTAPGRTLDINNSSGNDLRLTYNDADGSAVTYADFLISSAGVLSIQPTAGGGVTVAPTAGTSGSPTLLTVTGPAHTTLAANTEATDVNFNLARTVEFTGVFGGSPEQRAVRIQAPTYAMTSADTLSDAITFDISGGPVAGTNTMLTRSYAMRIAAGAVGAGTGTSYGFYVNAQTGATNNYAASFVGGHVGIGATAPDGRLEIAGAVSQAAWGLNGIQLQGTAATYTDTSTAASGTATNAVFASFGLPTLAATNTSVTTTNAATAYIANAPAAGTNMTISNAWALWVDAGNVRFDGAVVKGVQTLTVADSGGAGTATATLTPTSSYVEITCNDADGCDITMGETGIKQGQEVTIVNVSANAANFADTAGVSELATAFAAGQYDAIEMIYMSDRWVETARSNN